jgi:hypothetical protein
MSYFISLKIIKENGKDTIHSEVSSSILSRYLWPNVLDNKKTVKIPKLFVS